MRRLIVKKDMGAKGRQNFFFRNASQKKSFIYPYIPCTKSPYHSFMGRCASGRDQGCPDRSLLRRKLLLQRRYGFEEAGKGPFLQRTVRLQPFIFLKGSKTLLLKNPFRFIRK